MFLKSNTSKSLTSRLCANFSRRRTDPQDARSTKRPHRRSLFDFELLQPRILLSAAPTVAAPASAFPGVVTGNTASLSVLGADSDGESSLTYTWAITGTPPAAVSFSANGTNAAKDVTATFSVAGTYAFMVTITDTSDGLTATSSVDVTVQQTATSIVVTPTSEDVDVTQQDQFLAVEYDQFDHPMATQPTFNWTLESGMGSVAADGIYTAPVAVGSATVEAITGAFAGSAPITIEDAAPTVSSITTSAASATTADLSVAATDDAGAGNLSYQWSVVSEPNGAITPTFSVNGNNAAANTTATFYEAGDYQFQVTVTDASGLSTAISSGGAVDLSQTLTSIVITPPDAIATGNSEQLSAVGLDQFGDAMSTPPNISWSASDGTVSSNGTYDAPASVGIDTITANSGSIQDSTTISVANGTLYISAPTSVDGTSATLNVEGDVGGLLSTYSWSASGSATLSDETETSAIVNFSQAGSYSITYSNSALLGLLGSNTTTTDITVDQTLTNISVTPGSENSTQDGSESFTATAYDQFGNAMATQPNFSWAVTAGSGNFSAPGDYVAPDTATTATVAAFSGSILGSATVNVTNAAPTVAESGSTSSPTAPGTIDLSVVGADDGGVSNLTYTWSVTGTPPGPVGFSTNGTNSAQNTVATVLVPGTYDFLTTITNAGGASTTNQMTVVVSASSTTPPTITVPGAQLTAENTDLVFSSANGNAISVTNPQNAVEILSLVATDGVLTLGQTAELSFSSGNGTDDITLMFQGAPHAINNALDQVTFTPTAGDYGSAGLEISASVLGGTSDAFADIPIAIESTYDGPTVATAAQASPIPVTGTSTNLSVLGADLEYGQSNLTYTWSATSVPSGAASPSFSINGTNAADNTIATFSKAGTYQFVVTIANNQGDNTTSNVTVQVTPTLTTIAVTPAVSSLERGAGEQFNATAFDQFGIVLATQPVFTWSTRDGVGSINAVGDYSAPDAGIGNATILATSGSVSGSATVALVDELSLSAPGTQNTTFGTPLVFASPDAISVSDGDPNTQAVPLSLMLTATGGVVSLSAQSGLTFTTGTGSSDATMTFTGTLASINSALKGLTFTPNPGLGGIDSLGVKIDETGVGSVVEPSSTIPIDVSAAVVTPTSAPVVSAAAPAATSSLLSSTSGVTNSTPSAPPATSSSALFSTAPINDSLAMTASDVEPAPAPAPTVSTPASNSAQPQSAVAAKATGSAPAKAPAAAAVTPQTNSPQATTDVRVETIPGDVFKFLADQSPMLNNLDSIESQMTSQAELKFAAGSATVVSFGASAAYLAWLFRGGSLVSSLLSIFPAWKAIDPLPVLESFEDSRKRRKRQAGDAESLESLVDRSNRNLATVPAAARQQSPERKGNLS